jgi:hypothetical protein
MYVLKVDSVEAEGKLPEAEYSEVERDGEVGQGCHPWYMR